MLNVSRGCNKPSEQARGDIPLDALSFADLRSKENDDDDEKDNNSKGTQFNSDDSSHSDSELSPQTILYEALVNLEKHQNANTEEKTCLDERNSNNFSKGTLHVQAQNHTQTDAKLSCFLESSDKTTSASSSTQYSSATASTESSIRQLLQGITNWLDLNRLSCSTQQRCQTENEFDLASVEQSINTKKNASQTKEQHGFTASQVSTLQKMLPTMSSSKNTATTDTAAAIHTDINTKPKPLNTGSLEKKDFGDVLWETLRTTTDTAITELGEWVSNTVLNTESAVLKKKEINIVKPFGSTSFFPLSYSVPLTTTSNQNNITPNAFKNSSQQQKNPQNQNKHYSSQRSLPLTTKENQQKQHLVLRQHSHLSNVESQHFNNQPVSPHRQTRTVSDNPTSAPVNSSREFKTTCKPSFLRNSESRLILSNCRPSNNNLAQTRHELSSFSSLTNDRPQVSHLVSAKGQPAHFIQRDCNTKYAQNAKNSFLLTPSKKPAEPLSALTLSSSSSSQLSQQQNIDIAFSREDRRLPIVAKLPPKPSLELLCNTSNSRLLEKHFRKNFLYEPTIIPRRLVAPKPSLWQGLWHLYDPETRKVRLKRFRQSVYGNGPMSRQTIKSSKRACSVSLYTWRESWKSHLELSIFSTENCPLIGQIVIDTPGFRVDSPFNCLLVRIPVTHPDQVVSIWLNSAHEKPYNRHRNRLLFHAVVDENGLVESDDDTSSSSDGLNDEEDDEEDLQENWRILGEQNKKLIMSGQTHLPLQNAPFGRYHPGTCWPTYFRFDIPVSEVIDMGVIETSSLLPPQGVFYDNNRNSITPKQCFRILCRESFKNLHDPRIKFCVKYVHQGLKNLICTGDSTPYHLLSVAKTNQFYSSKDVTYPNDTISQMPPPIVDWKLFDGRFKGYELMPNCSEFPMREIRVYVADFSDPIDQQIAIELNRNQGETLASLERRNLQNLSNSLHSNPIDRIFPGLYNIFNEELRVVVEEVSLQHPFMSFTNYNLQPDDPLYSSNKTHLKLAIVHGSDFHQPLRDYVTGTRTNMSRKSSLDTYNPNNWTGGGIIDSTILSNHHDDQNDYKNRRPKVLLPDFILPSSSLPWGVRQHPQRMFKLTRHAEAIRENIIRKALGPNTDEPSSKLVRYLEPPLIQFHPEDAPIPSTFYWDNNNFHCTNVRVEPIDLTKGPRGGLSYLQPPQWDL